MFPKPSDQNPMNDQNAKPNPNQPKGHSGSSTDSGLDELSTNNQTSESTLFSPQIENQLIKKLDSHQNKSAMHLSPVEKQTSIWGKMRLRTKATLIAIALGTLPIVTVGTIAYQIANKQLVQQIQQDKIDTANALSEEIGQFIFQRAGDLQVLARLPILANSQVKAIVPLQNKVEILDQFLKSYRVYDSIAVADLAGNTILQSTGEPITDLGKRDYFKEVIKTDRPVITPPRKSALTGEYSIFMAAPVKDSVTGKTIAVVRSRMPIKLVAKVFERYGHGAEELFLIGPDGKIFLAEKAEEVGKEAKLLFPQSSSIASGTQACYQSRY